MPILKTENLTHVYSAGTPFERTALHDINYQVEKGEYLGIIGATGSGKSTFISHLNGLMKPTSGRVLYEDRDIHESKSFTREIRFKVGLVFQYPEYQLFESTVFEDIAFGPKNMGLSDADVNERVLEAAGFAGLNDKLLKKSPFELSGGEKRRAAIAGVIAMRPTVLILDEPTAGLDPRGRDEVIGNVMNYKNAHGATIIMVTHDMEQIARSVDRIVILSNGNVEMEGAPAQIFSQDERLKQLGLSVPKVTLVAARLRALGLPLPVDIYTSDMLRKALNDLRKNESDSHRNHQGGADNA